jgi:hypothetical protein
LIGLGIVPFVVVLLLLIIDIPSDFSTSISTYIGHIIWGTLYILLIINNKRIRDELNSPDFTMYFQMITVYGICSIVQFLVYDVLDFAENILVISIGSFIYALIQLAASIFALIAWINLGKYGSSLRTFIGGKIQTGAIILSIGEGFVILLQITDFVSNFLFIDAIMDRMISIFVRIGGTMSIIGYFMVGNQVKKFVPFQIVSESSLDQISTAYVPPSPKGSVIFCIRCGTMLPQGVEFCSGCGWKIPKTYE